MKNIGYSLLNFFVLVATLCCCLTLILDLPSDLIELLNAGFKGLCLGLSLAIILPAVKALLLLIMSGYFQEDSH